MRVPPAIWRWALAFIANVLYFIVPLPLSLPFWVNPVRWGIGALVAICLVGKLLYDTLFFDRYRP